MPEIPDNAEDYIAALPAFERELQAEYKKFVEELRAIAPDLIERHEAQSALIYNNEDGLDELIKMIGDPTQEPQ